MVAPVESDRTRGTRRSGRVWMGSGGAGVSWAWSIVVCVWVEEDCVCRPPRPPPRPPRAPRRLPPFPPADPACELEFGRPAAAPWDPPAAPPPSPPPRTAPPSGHGDTIAMFARGTNTRRPSERPPPIPAHARGTRGPRGRSVRREDRMRSRLQCEKARTKMGTNCGTGMLTHSLGDTDSGIVWLGRKEKRRKGWCVVMRMMRR